jgi:hypothetical protein
MSNLVFIDMAFAQHALWLSNHPQILKFDLLFVDMASIPLPLWPTIHKSSCHKLTALFLFSFLASFFLFNKVACKGYFCASIVNNMFVWRLFISHGKRKVYTNCWLGIILLKISSGQFFKTWNKRIFRVLKISKLFYHQLGYLSNSSQGYHNRWMCETDSLIMVTVSWLIIEINF